jgi:hypothetical protein
MIRIESSGCLSSQAWNMKSFFQVTKYTHAATERHPCGMACVMARWRHRSKTRLVSSVLDISPSSLPFGHSSGLAPINHKPHS